MRRVAFLLVPTFACLAGPSLTNACDNGATSARIPIFDAGDATEGVFVVPDAGNDSADGGNAAPDAHDAGPDAASRDADADAALDADGGGADAGSDSTAATDSSDSG